MAYTEIKERNGKKYFYRVSSIRQGNKVKKRRIYLGVNLNKKDLMGKEAIADKSLMKTKTNKNLEKIKSKIINILKKYGIKKAGLFGSYARGEQKESSDIDILIKPAKDMSLLVISGLKIDLEKILGKKVDIVSYKYIHPYIKDRILNSEIKII
ncbi:MAG: nucleotidyltransferase family protein [Candidatus Pacearchaeota archaeon]